MSRCEPKQIPKKEHWRTKNYMVSLRWPLRYKGFKRNTLVVHTVQYWQICVCNEYNHSCLSQAVIINHMKHYTVRPNSSYQACHVNDFTRAYWGKSCSSQSRLTKHLKIKKLANPGGTTLPPPMINGTHLSLLYIDNPVLKNKCKSLANMKNHCQAHDLIYIV